MLINILKAKILDLKKKKESSYVIRIFTFYIEPWQLKSILAGYLKFWLWVCLLIRKRTDNETFKKIIGWSMYYFLYFAPFFLLFYLIGKYARFL